MATSTEIMLCEHSQEEYRDARQTIFNDLRLLNLCLDVLEGILSYREIFSGTYIQDFMFVVGESCFSNGVIIIHRIWENKRSGRCTFKYLYDFVQSNLKKENKLLWQQQFGDLTPKEKKGKILSQQLQAVRHIHVAHSSLEAHVPTTRNRTTSGDEREKISLASEVLEVAELRRATDLSAEYFRKFEPNFPIPFKDPLMKDTVERVFDALALKTPMVSLYRSDQERWNIEYGTESAGSDVEELIKGIFRRNPPG